MRPSTVGNYELVRSLGVGGMAETYEAIRRGPAGFSQRVCLKRMLPQQLSVPSAVELFLDEARLSAHLRCASIAQVIDFGEAEGSYYIALELVEGENLETLLRGQMERGEKLSPAVVTYVAAELLAALDYAHTLAQDGAPLGIVHRDVSPSNVMVSVRGEVKLTDFGIAKARGRSHRTRSGYTKGKLAYMSPEQARADTLDGRSDLFSLGIVLYELLAQRHPFEANTDLELLQNIVESRFPPLEQVAPEAPRELRVLVERLLRAEPARRLSSAAEALRLLPFVGSPYLAQAELAQVVAAQRGDARAKLPAQAAAAPTKTLEVGLARTEPQGEAAPFQPATGTGEALQPWRSTPTRRVILALVALAFAAAAVLALRGRNTPVATPNAPAVARPAEPGPTTASPTAAPVPPVLRNDTPSAPAPVDAQVEPQVEKPAPKPRPARRGERPVDRAEPDKVKTAPPSDRNRSGAEVSPEQFL